MGKKILGILFFVIALLVVIGFIGDGAVLGQGSSAATIGSFIGTLLPVILYIFSGIFLLTFDNPTKINYIDGFKKRSKQSSKMVVFMVAYAFLMLLVAVGVGASDTNNFVLSFVVTVLPYLIPFLIFVVLFQMYALPHKTSKKHFISNDEALNEYLSPNETFYAYSDDNFVLASNKALYFPKLFCVIPFDQIASITLTKQLWEQDVYFTLHNGKKFYIVTKHYDRIQEAATANGVVQQ